MPVIKNLKIVRWFESEISFDKFLLKTMDNVLSRKLNVIIKPNHFISSIKVENPLTLQTCVLHENY